MIFGFNLILLVATKLEILNLVWLTEKDNYGCSNRNEDFRGTILARPLSQLSLKSSQFRNEEIAVIERSKDR